MIISFFVIGRDGVSEPPSVRLKAVRELLRLLGGQQQPYLPPCIILALGMAGTSAHTRQSSQGS